MKKICFWQHIFFYVILTIFAGTAVWARGAAEPVKIGVAWEGEARMAERVSRGMMEVLEQLAPNILVEFEKALPDLAALDRAVRRFEKEKAAMVILRSSGAKYLAQHLPAIPAFVGGCNDPVLLGALKNRNAPEGNITGVTYAPSYDHIFEIFTALLPGMQSVLLLTQAGHPSAPIDITGTRAVCRQLKIQPFFKECRTTADAVDTVNAFQAKVSAVIVPNHARILDYAVQIVAAAGKTPVLAYSIAPVKEGGLCGLTADDIKLGRMLAESIIDVLINKKPVSSVPVKRDMNPQVYINMRTAQNIGVSIPFPILEIATIVR